MDPALNFVFVTAPTCHDANTISILLTACYMAKLPSHVVGHNVEIVGGMI